MARRPIVCIYKITSPTNKVYIGQSWIWQKRLESYNRLAFKAQAKLYSSVQSHGWKNHIVEVIHELPNDVTQEVLDNYEVLYWQAYKDCGIEMLNLKEPGKGKRHSAETIEKLKIANNLNKRCGEKNNMWGKFGSLNHRYGKKQSENHRIAMSRKLIDEETGGIYPSIKEAANQIGIKPATLSSRLRYNCSKKPILKYLEPEIYPKKKKHKKYE